MNNYVRCKCPNDPLVTELYYAQIDFIERSLFQSRVVWQSMLTEFCTTRRRRLWPLFLHQHLHASCALHRRFRTRLQLGKTDVSGHGCSQYLRHTFTQTCWDWDRSATWRTAPFCFSYSVSVAATGCTVQK